MPDSVHPLALWLACAVVGILLGGWWSGWRLPSGWRGWLAAVAAMGLMAWCGREALLVGWEAGRPVACDCGREAAGAATAAGALALGWGGFAVGAACALCYGLCAPVRVARAQAQPQAAGEPSAPPEPVVPPTKEMPKPTVSATKDQPFENSLGMKFVPVPVGGGKEVLFSVWQTRRKDYAAYAEANLGGDDSWRNATYEGQRVGHGEDHPVVMVSWEDAVDFCKWLTRKERAEGRIGPAYEYRLPTDGEWSWAVGIGEREDVRKTPKEKDEKIANVFPWGASWPPPKGAGNYCGEETRGKFPGWSVIEGYNDGHVTTAPVGSFAANRLALFDLGGNVWEWCDDFYDGKSGTRMLRGGSWLSRVRSLLLSSYRDRDYAGYRRSHGGFRCVLELSARKVPALTMDPISAAIVKGGTT